MAQQVYGERQCQAAGRQRHKALTSCASCLMGSGPNRLYRPPGTSSSENASSSVMPLSWTGRQAASEGWEKRDPAPPWGTHLRAERRPQVATAQEVRRLLLCSWLQLWACNAVQRHAQRSVRAERQVSPQCEHACE